MNDKYFKNHEILLNKKLMLRLKRQIAVFYRYLMFT